MPNAKILLIDDDEIILNLLSAYLEEMDFNVLTANDGAKGVMMASKETPDVVILDMQMPAMDGLTVLSRIRSAIDTQQTPVLMLTSNDKLASADQAFELGADGYLIKPIDPVILADKVNQALLAKSSPPAPSDFAV